VQIDEAKRAFRVFAERKPDPREPDGYVVPHTAIAYLLDPDRAYCAHFADSIDEDEVFNRLSALVSLEDLARNKENE
jgi:protein SCO1/2